MAQFDVIFKLDSKRNYGFHNEIITADKYHFDAAADAYVFTNVDDRVPVAEVSRVSVLMIRKNIE